jgi:hypothetical protein
MTFGTTGRARLLNLLPLHQRFTETARRALPLVHQPDDGDNEWMVQRLGDWSARIDAAKRLPGWDADGREAP